VIESEKLLPKDKADQLLYIFENIGMSKNIALMCAYVCVDEIIKALSEKTNQESFIKLLYFAEVKNYLIFMIEDNIQ
jgi:hypothetical protein